MPSRSPRSLWLILHGRWGVLAVLLFAASALVLLVIQKNRAEASIAALQQMRAHLGFPSREVPWWARWLISPQKLPPSRRIISIAWPDGRGTDNLLFEMAQLDGLTGLVTLRLAGGEITDQGLFHIERLVDLRFLDLSSTQISDSGLSHLARMKELEGLNLSDTGITDAGLSQLKGLTKLKSLDVTNTRVTHAGVSELQRTLPKLHVEE